MNKKIIGSMICILFLVSNICIATGVEKINIKKPVEDMSISEEIITDTSSGYDVTFKGGFGLTVTVSGDRDKLQGTDWKIKHDGFKNWLGPFAYGGAIQIGGNEIELVFRIIFVAGASDDAIFEVYESGTFICKKTGGVRGLFVFLD